MTPWTRADYERDISDQTEEHNAAWRDEVMSQRNEDWIDIYDYRTPTRAECAEDDQ